jgi:hypothetical protein
MLGSFSFIPHACLAAEWLEPGKHEHEGGEYIGKLTIVVPPAISTGKKLPLVLVISSQEKVEMAGWQEWAETRGVAVVLWGGAKVQVDRLTLEKNYEKTIAAIKQLVPIHDFMRMCYADTNLTQTAFLIARVAGKDFAGILIPSPTLTGMTFDYVNPDLPFIFIMDSKAPTVEIRKMQDEGKTAKVVSVTKLGTSEPPFPIIRRCMDYTFNLARATNKGFSARERASNLDEIAAQIQELPGIVDDETRMMYAQYLMAVTGIEKRRKDNERLAEIWLEGATNVALAKEKEDAIEGHEWLSGIVKSSLYKDASAKYQKTAYDELKRMRRDPKIKKEIASADYYVDVLAMLEKDNSIAKQRIALKDLETMVIRYPGTHAAKVAEELIVLLRSNTK